MLNELSVEEIIDAILEKQDSCTYLEIYDACEEYCKKHRGIYIDKSGDTVDYYLYGDINKYWVDKHYIIYKQVIFVCPLCDIPHRKYPEVEKFNVLTAKAKKWLKKVIH